MIQFLLRLARALPAQFGPNCEVVIHDLQSNDPDSSIVAIENGHVSGRKVGDGPSHVVLEALNSGTAVEDRLSYLTKTADGKTLKSTTVYIRDEDQTPIGVFSINYDITLMLAMEETLRQFTSTTPETQDNVPEPIAKNVSDLLDELIEQSVKRVGKPVALMTKEEKVKAIGFLNDTGAFLITKSGGRVCKYFGISKYTLYSYIEEAKGGKE
ncbi:MAG: helix-turn-helix transcriptional regulator [Butyricicoccus sp.]|nr:helix-turn-helix transcriptional regulator [Butyricicoccus sp.]